MPPIPRLFITPGEPAGIGPDILIQLAQQPSAAEIVAVSSPDLLLARAKLLQLPLTLQEFNPDAPRQKHVQSTLRIVPVSLAADCVPGQLNPANAAHVLETLRIAADACLHRIADAVVTGPVNKAVINDAGIAFSGHTEFFAKYCGQDDVIMLFVAGKLKVALATTHLPLSQVPQAIKTEKLTRLLLLLNSEIKKTFGLREPKIFVCGLNPHAGENGHLGREEIDIIQPAIRCAQKEGLNITGPLPADTIFTEQYLANADVVLAMYHDQALPVVKSLSFGHAVNVTLGLPFLRTSVDHGTALDIAGTGKADEGSLKAAVELALTLSR